MKPQHYAQELYAAIADDVVVARDRLKVLELTDEELLEQLHIAQRHDPRTGFAHDTAAVVALTMERNHRRDAAAHAAAAIAAQFAGTRLEPQPEGHVWNPKEHGRQKDAIYRFVMEQQSRLNQRVPALVDALLAGGFRRDRQTSAYIRGEARVFYSAGAPSIQYSLNTLKAYSFFDAKAVHSVAYVVNDRLDAEPAEIVDQIVAAANAAQAEHDRYLADLAAGQTQRT